jgi:dihydropteroate synthase
MFTLHCKGKEWIIDEPIVMGIINSTPDSFYSGSRSQDLDDIIAKAEKMLREGARILDIGGQSTRPGSQPIGVEEELKRVIDPIKAIKKHFPHSMVSIDTYHSKVASEAIAAGASMVNDISAGSIDPHMIKVVAALKVPYVLMHMKGTPQTMQQEAKYDDVVNEVLSFFEIRKKQIQAEGIKDIIIDPGFGFAKTISHNFTLLRELERFQALGSPVMLGISRKSTVYKTLEVSPEEAMNGTTVLHTIGLINQANILRVHDVQEAMEAIKLVQAYRK